VLAVWKLDRLSRSLKDLLHIMEQVSDAGAGFRGITEAVDNTTSAGLMVMQMLGSFAEFERSMVRERTRAGLAAARNRGARLGRPAKLSPSGFASPTAASPPLAQQRSHPVAERQRTYS
jgi:DNA invertase Pin-like site-specific DNA recombinase